MNWCTISPGTIIDADVIEGKENNFLAALYDGGMTGYGLAYVDVTTGEFRATWESGSDSWAEILSELGTLNPSELLLDSASLQDEELQKQIKNQANCLMTGIHNANFSPTLFEQSGVEEIRELENL